MLDPYDHCDVFSIPLSGWTKQEDPMLGFIGEKSKNPAKNATRAGIR